MDRHHEQSTNARLDQLTELMSNFIRTMTERERVNSAPTVEPVPMAIPIPENRGIRSMSEQFSKKKPKEFHGYTDTSLAEHWLMDMERIFRTLPMTDAQKIENASDMLTDEAQNWWVNVLDQGAPITWEGFKAEFNRRFFPRAVHNEKKREFDSLRQGDMTVT